MPFKSKAQERWAFATHQPFAESWAKITNQKSLSARKRGKVKKKMKMKNHPMKDSEMMDESEMEGMMGKGKNVVIKGKGKKPLRFKKGALHRQLGVPEGEPIPASKRKAALAGKYGPEAKKRAFFAFKGALAKGRKTAGKAVSGRKYSNTEKSFIRSIRSQIPRSPAGGRK